MNGCGFGYEECTEVPIKTNKEIWLHTKSILRPFHRQAGSFEMKNHA